MKMGLRNVLQLSGKTNCATNLPNSRAHQTSSWTLSQLVSLQSLVACNTVKRRLNSVPESYVGITQRAWAWKGAKPTCIIMGSKDLASHRTSSWHAETTYNFWRFPGGCTPKLFRSWNESCAECSSRTKVSSKHSNRRYTFIQSVLAIVPRSMHEHPFITNSEII